jgi:hypothetical protein
MIVRCYLKLESRMITVKIEVRGKKEKNKKIEEGKITERKRGHAGAIAALCDLSENLRQKCSAMRPLVVTHICNSP